MLTNRRKFVFGAGALVAMASVPFFLRPAGRSTAAEGTFQVEMSEAEWQAKLSPDQFAVLRQEATERPWTSPLLEEKRAGTFLCAGCALPLFSSTTKYESGTGWPSFWEPIAPEAIGTYEDGSLGMVRTECHCARCGGHQGHIFDDGPQPTGLRYCINGVSLTFEPTAA